MNFKRTAKIGAFALSACLAFSVLPVAAEDTPKVTITFTDVTETDLTTLSGEAKIMVSVSGAEGKATIAQASFGFDGDLQYKSISFLTGENNPPSGFCYSPNAKAANANKKFSASIISTAGLDFSDNEDLFVITFSGEPGKSVTLNLADLDATYCTVDDIDRKADGNAEITVTASANENKGKTAAIKLTMDKVTDFNGASDADTGITVTITREDNSGYTITDVLDNELTSKGGNRESETIPTFTVEKTVLDGSTYTVEISGIGYVTYKKTGVTFDEVLSVTNADFIPGDVNADGKVDAEDKKAFDELNGEYRESADFNRDGKADSYDRNVLKDFDTSEDDKKVPEKMTAPTVTGGTNKITVTWAKPSDESVTGYTVKYGTSRNDLANTLKIDKADTLTAEIKNLSANTNYYVAIAAENANGTGEFSDTASAKTDRADTPSGGGPSGGGITGGGTSGGSTSGDKDDSGSKGDSGTGSGTTTTPTETTTETFTDLENHAWAKESIYTLKNKGIISGISETEFAPANNIKRGDFILILTRMLSVNDAFTENFNDVPQGSYYYNAIGSAKAAGIAKGSGDIFMPEESITRQDLITLAYRAFLAKGYITETTDLTSLDAFGDKDSISDYAQISMASMVKAGIIKGSDGNVNPLGSATRAEVAVMCARLLALMK